MPPAAASAAIYSLIESANSMLSTRSTTIADLLARIADRPARCIGELLPWTGQPLDDTRAAA
jgi:hypothetical protein